MVPPIPKHPMQQAEPDSNETRAPDRTSGGPPSPSSTSEEQQFYRTLEQTGQLVDVDAETDLSSLPPGVTHVRYPDGRVERIGFS